MSDTSWQFVVLTLILQVGAVGLAYVNRNRKTPSA